MKNEDAVAEFLLKEVEIKESLKKRMSESALDYYTGRHLFGVAAGLFFIGVLVYVSINRNIPIWGVLSLAMAMTALMESKRNSGRVDAMIKLSAMSESEPDGAGQPHLRARNSTTT
ncbi:MAG: hypothetical protein ACFE0O_07045 [Opitutales bacterium]